MTGAVYNDAYRPMLAIAKHPKAMANFLNSALVLPIAMALHRHSLRLLKVVLKVQDTGTGIPSEEIPHLFERYHQVRGARARIPEGTGIALAIPCGLIIYELVSTVLKHAFTNGLKEIIKVAFSSEDLKGYTLLVRNSAVNLNRNLDLNSVSSLRLQLV